jgi:hypothetical protein
MRERERERERESSTSFTVGPHALPREQIDTKSISPFNRRQQHELCERGVDSRAQTYTREKEGKDSESFVLAWLSANATSTTEDRRAARAPHSHSGTLGRECTRRHTCATKFYDRYQCLLGVAFARCQVSLQGVVATKSLLVRHQRRTPARAPSSERKARCAKARAPSCTRVARKFEPHSSRVAHLLSSAARNAAAPSAGAPIGLNVDPAGLFSEWSGMCPISDSRKLTYYLIAGLGRSKRLENGWWPAMGRGGVPSWMKPPKQFEPRKLSVPPGYKRQGYQEEQECGGGKYIGEWKDGT